MNEVTAPLRGEGAELEERVAAVRAFNRFWTGVIRVLNAGLLDTPYSLTEARVVYELAQADTVDLLDLRRRLGLDPSYLSRILGRFKADGMLEARTSSSDARRQVLQLTKRGRGAFDMLDERSAHENRTLLSRLTDEEQQRLLEAMTTIRGIIERAPEPAAYAIRPLEAGDLGWVVQRHGFLYAQEQGWDYTFEALVARIVADYADRHQPGRDNAWIAEFDGEPAGCVFCVRKDDAEARLRLLLVDPRARGLGIGRRLVNECVRFARDAGYQRLTLWTNDVLVSARRIYEATGFRLLEQDPHSSFGHDLVGQNWALDLVPEHETRPRL